MSLSRGCLWTRARDIHGCKGVPLVSGAIGYGAGAGAGAGAVIVLKGQTQCPFNTRKFLPVGRVRMRTEFKNPLFVLAVVLLFAATFLTGIGGMLDLTGSKGFVLSKEHFWNDIPDCP